MNTQIIYVPSKKFVYFDEHGELLSVGNSNDSEGLYIEVELNEVYNLITGQEQLAQYQVIFDTAKKQHILRHKFNEEEIVFDINVQIHKISRLQDKDQNEDLRIVQDIQNNKWVIMLNDTIKENLKNKKLSFNKPLIFSITRFNDPHQLERFLRIDINDLLEKNVEIPFTTQIEVDSVALSVYTIKRFETYYHEVINE